MDNETTKALHRIAERYEVYGITFDIVQAIYNTKPEGISDKAALLGIRLSLSLEYGVEEFFDTNDIAEIHGCTPQEAEQLMKEKGAHEIKMTSILPGLF